MSTATAMEIPERVEVWRSVSDPNHMARVLKVERYTGRYPEFFTHVLTLEAPNTKKREIEMAYDARNPA